MNVLAVARGHLGIWQQGNVANGFIIAVNANNQTMVMSIWAPAVWNTQFRNMKYCGLVTSWYKENYSKKTIWQLYSRSPVLLFSLKLLILLPRIGWVKFDTMDKVLHIDDYNKSFSLVILCMLLTRTWSYLCES